MIRLAALLIRGVAAVFTGLLIAGGTLTIAADHVAPQRPTLVPVAASPKTLVVPQVTGQAYVFAKGILQDGGFAWRVLGTVRGYAGNTVADQQPAAGSVVVDTGAPTITLTLARNKGFAERGGPDNTAPYAGTTVLLTAGSAASSTVPVRRPAAHR
jgi:PASTA domain